MTLAAGERALAADPLARVVAAADTGARRPKGFAGGVLLAVALAWSLFQLWIASPLPFALGVFILNDSEARAIHLAFALFLAFAAYPALKSSSRARIPWHDWLLALLGAFCAGYLFLFYAELATRPGLPNGLDLTVAVAGLGVMAFGDDYQVATVRFGSPAARLGIEPGFTIEAVEWPNQRPAKEWMFIPALALLALVIVPQRRRAAAAKRA